MLRLLPKPWQRITGLPEGDDGQVAVVHRVAHSVWESSPGWKYLGQNCMLMLMLMQQREMLAHLENQGAVLLENSAR